MISRVVLTIAFMVAFVMLTPVHDFMSKPVDPKIGEQMGFGMVVSAVFLLIVFGWTSDKIMTGVEWLIDKVRRKRVEDEVDHRKVFPTELYKRQRCWMCKGSGWVLDVDGSRRCHCKN